MIQKILNIEEVSYSSNLSEESLKKKIEVLFGQSNLPLSGKLISENEFTAYDKWAFISWNMPNLRRQVAYLEGKITKREKGTLINLKVKPNSVLPFFAILAALIGGIITIKALSNTEDDTFLLILGLVFIAVAIIYYPMSTLFKNRLRNKIVKYLDLDKL